MDAHGRTQRLVDPVDRIKHEAWPAVAKNDRRDHHMQTVKAAGCKEARERGGAALDEHAAQSHFTEAGEDRRWGDMPIDLGESKDLDAAGMAPARALRGDDEAAG